MTDLSCYAIHLNHHLVASQPTDIERDVDESWLIITLERFHERCFHHRRSAELPIFKSFLLRYYGSEDCIVRGARQMYEGTNHWPVAFDIVTTFSRSHYLCAPHLRLNHGSNRLNWALKYAVIELPEPTAAFEFLVQPAARCDIPLSTEEGSQR